MEIIDSGWESFYNELAWCLLKYKDKRKDLIDIVTAAFKDNNISMPKMENGPLVDIDPFTIFGTFNRQIRDINRINILKTFALKFSIKSRVPASFEGVPVVDNRNATFYWFIPHRDKNDISDLWELFEAALKYSTDSNNSNKTNFIKYFDLCINKKGNGNSKITMGLFWLNPSFYLNLDRRNKWFIYESNKLPESFVKTLPELPNSKFSGDIYLEVLEKLHSFVKGQSSDFDSFKSLSFEAWRYSTEVNESKRESSNSVLGDDDIDETRYWLYAPGSSASKWDEFYNKGIMAIGWGAIGDLSEYQTKEEMRLAITEKLSPEKSNTNSAHATWQFCNEMKPGDIVFVKKGTNKIIGKGIVQSDYYFDDSITDGYKNCRKVDWVIKGEWNHPGKAATKTLTDITQYTEYVEKLNKLVVDEEEDVPAPVIVENKDYGKEEFLSEVYISESEYEKLVSLLKYKKNIILQGAPGVGKTFVAKRLAYSILGSKDKNKVQMIQFHQSYSYEDFIEGSRPKDNTFSLHKGAFYNFCNTASQDKENKYFFIIDEINRGNLSKIFGELFMLVEADKRNIELPLLYSGDKFKVPDNVYIIGLMNTADRSLAMLDYALRRRFAFYTMKPGFNTSGFKKYQSELNNEKFDRLIIAIENLNSSISNDDSLGEDFMIGHSYFSNLKEVTESTINNIIEFEIIPLLKEYWFDDPNKVKEWSNKLRSI